MRAQSPSGQAVSRTIWAYKIKISSLRPQDVLLTKNQTIGSSIDKKNRLQAALLITNQTTDSLADKKSDFRMSC